MPTTPIPAAANPVAPVTPDAGSQAGGLRNLVPGALKSAAGPAVHWVVDARARRRGNLIPPWSLRSQVTYGTVGQEFLGYMVDLGGLRPTDHVLEIGTRVGRMAIPLAGYLDADGRYDGVDDWVEGTDWCHRTITPRHPTFRFQQLAMGPQPDQPDRTGPSPLPYPDATFDFVLVGSIAQLTPDTFDFYLREAARVARPGAAYLGTWYLWHQGPAGSEKRPVLVTTEEEARQRLASLGLVVEAVHRGLWDEAPSPLSYQDVVIARKA